jgi:hypothetical protein
MAGKAARSAAGAAPVPEGLRRDGSQPTFGRFGREKGQDDGNARLSRVLTLNNKRFRPSGVLGWFRSRRSTDGLQASGFAMSNYVAVTTNEDDRALINLAAATRIVELKVEGSTFVRVFFDNGRFIDLAEDYKRFENVALDLEWDMPAALPPHDGVDLYRLFGISSAS